MRSNKRGLHDARGRAKINKNISRYISFFLTSSSCFFVPTFLPSFLFFAYLLTYLLAYLLSNNNNNNNI